MTRDSSATFARPDDEVVRLQHQAARLLREGLRARVLELPQRDRRPDVGRREQPGASGRLEEVRPGGEPSRIQEVDDDVGAGRLLTDVAEHVQRGVGRKALGHQDERLAAVTSPSLTIACRTMRSVAASCVR